MYETPFPSSYRLNNITAVFSTRMNLALNNSRRLILRKKKRPYQLSHFFVTWYRLHGLVLKATFDFAQDSLKPIFFFFNTITIFNV